ncbi:ABC transporter permease subunit [Cellulomonas soli]
MSTTTAPATGAHAIVAAAPPRARVTFGHLLRAEWIKFWTLRSTFWTLASTAVVFLGLVTLVSLVMRSVTSGDLGEDASTVAVMPFAVAVQMSSLAIVVLGVLTITGEYSTGMIRSSLTAAPTRLPVLWAKAVVVAVVTLALAVVVIAISAGLATLIFDGSSVTFDLSSAETQRVLYGSAVYLATIALFAFAIGALLRHSAAALATILGLLIIVENVISGIPWAPLQYISPWLPASAGSRLMSPQATIDLLNEMNTRGVDLNAWQGYGVLVAWVIVLLTAAAIRLRTRDA